MKKEKIVKTADWNEWLRRVFKYVDKEEIKDVEIPILLVEKDLIKHNSKRYVKE